MHGARFARRVLAWARRRRRRVHDPHGLVLMYHRIARAEIDPWGLTVSPENFESQVRRLRGRADVVPLGEFHASLRSGRRSRPIVAITFDDGYLDNLEIAKPVLERHSVPATVFVATGFIGIDRGFWWDRLAELILGRSQLGEAVELTHGESDFSWNDAALRLGGRAEAAARRRLHDALWRWLHRLDSADRERALGQLEAAANRRTPPISVGRPMQAEELKSLVTGGLIDVGAHSINHPLLTGLTTMQKASEIYGSRERVSQLLGRPPVAFAFPNGDFDDECTALVREAGFRVACTSEQELVWSGSDPLRTPRISVRNVSGETLLKRLRLEWLP